MISFVSKQGHATKVFMQMPLPLPLSLPLLGCSRFRKLIHPLLMTILSQGLVGGRCLPIEPLLR